MKTKRKSPAARRADQEERYLRAYYGRHLSSFGVVTFEEVLALFRQSGLSSHTWVRQFEGLSDDDTELEDEDPDLVDESEPDTQ